MTNLEIEAFQAIAKTKNITKAANNLYITQSALSRRLHALESELGYRLFCRQKGGRCLELTEQGNAFISVAEKWKCMWREAQQIGVLDPPQSLNISCVDSFSTIIMPHIFRNFAQSCPTARLSLQTFHSHESYGYIERGEIDLAFISDAMYSSQVETRPLYTEPMVFVCGKNANYPQRLSPSQLCIDKEIRIPWCPECDMWHDYWFGENSMPHLLIDKISFFQPFLFEDDSWAILPLSVAHQLEHILGTVIRDLQNAPPDRFIYCLQDQKRQSALAKNFLETLLKALADFPGIQLLV